MKRIVCAALMLLPTVAVSQELPLSKDYAGNYLCKMTASAGIHLDETSGKWVTTGINVDDMSYIVNVIDTGETLRPEADIEEIMRIYNITVKDFDRKGQAFPCLDKIKTGRENRKKIELYNGSASCDVVFYQYSFDFETLKMQAMFEGGYMDTVPNTDTPYVAVGKCQRIG